MVVGGQKGKGRVARVNTPRGTQPGEETETGMHVIFFPLLLSGDPRMCHGTDWKILLTTMAEIRIKTMIQTAGGVDRHSTGLAGNSPQD